MAKQTNKTAQDYDRREKCYEENCEVALVYLHIPRLKHMGIWCLSTDVKGAGEMAGRGSEEE